MFPRRATGTRVPASINKTQYSFENCDKGAIYCALGRFFACAHMRLKDSRKGTLPGNEIYVHKYCDRIFRRYGDYSDIVLGDSYCSRFRLASCFRYNFRLINKSVEMVFFFSCDSAISEMRQNTQFSRLFTDLTWSNFIYQSMLILINLFYNQTNFYFNRINLIRLLFRKNTILQRLFQDNKSVF